jgi:molybdopterin converting factor small subunit
MIVKHLKRQGLVVNKGYEKKQKILESEVSGSAVKELKIGAVLERITKFEEDLKTAPNGEVVQQLINLYNKAIEYYSAINDEKHMTYLQKL